MGTIKRKRLALLCERQGINWAGVLTGQVQPTVNVNVTLDPETTEYIDQSILALGLTVAAGAAIGSAAGTYFAK